MRANHFATAFLTVILGAAATATGCSAPATEAGQTADQADTTSGSAWSTTRAARQAALDAYITTNAADFAAFKNAPLGDAGIPMIMLRLFPEIFPDIWGKPDAYMANVGFAKDPYEPARVLPLGLGFMGSNPPITVPISATATVDVHVQVAQLTCMGCHGGRVVGPDGTVKTVIGAPNTQFSQFRGAIGRTVNDPRYTADTFRAALAAKPIGWLYGDPAMVQQEVLERAIFNAPATDTAPSGADQFLGGLKAKVNFGAQRWVATLGSYTYQVPNAPDPRLPQPGFLDAIGAGIAIIVDPTKYTPDQLKAILPPAPAEIDIMSVWKQSDRPAAQWDGSIGNALHRNLAAEFGVVGDPSHLNMQNANRTTVFTQSLPSTPYPFDVNTSSAARGKDLYVEYCASCHTAGNASIFTTASVGTDANRAKIWSPFTVGGLRSVLRMACTDPITCNHADGTPLTDAEILQPTGGYMAIPLDGIWARAPYLHNGAVPNLRALLTGDRPATFWRGNINYDQANVGFVTTAGVVQYDTTRAGHANTGHSTATFLGDVDWKHDTQKTNDLLEYLKTL
jgi:mono/diheme cytochrome c family protein